MPEWQDGNRRVPGCTFPQYSRISKWCMINRYDNANMDSGICTTHAPRKKEKEKKINMKNRRYRRHELRQIRGTKPTTPKSRMLSMGTAHRMPSGAIWTAC